MYVGNCTDRPRSSLLRELCEHLGQLVPLDEEEEVLLVRLQDGAAVAQDGARVQLRLEPLEGQTGALRLVELVLCFRQPYVKCAGYFLCSM